MNYSIYKADYGYRITINGEHFYIGERTEQGYAYKDSKAFNMRTKNAPCYISEYSFMDEVEYDENVPDELEEICDKHDIPICGVGMWDENLKKGETYQDIRQNVIDAMNPDFVAEKRKQCRELFNKFVTQMTKAAFEICDWQSTSAWLYGDCDFDEAWYYFTHTNKKN